MDFQFIRQGTLYRVHTDVGDGPADVQVQQRPRDGYGGYGTTCALCGGTSTGDSPRGYVGLCSCRKRAGGVLS